MTDTLFFLPEAKREASARLFCFPHAGGGPLVFFDWQAAFGPAIECVSVQYPGRGQRIRENSRTNLDELAEEIAEGFSRWEEKPYAFYGHSFGGMLAFEVARLLRRSSGRGPGALYVGAVRPPQIPSPHPPLRGLPDAEFIEGVQARYGGIPEAISRNPEVLELFLPPMRSDFSAYETYTYRPESPLDIPISVFAGEDDHTVDRHSLEEWRVHSTGRFDLNVLPGGHFFPAVSRSELIGMLLTRMRAHLPLEGSPPNV